MKKRLIILSALVAVFAGAVLAFPESPAMKPSRLARSLPKSFSNWVGKPEEPGKREKDILAKDTEFERMSYFDQDGLLPAIQASIVFSGKNLSQSIHRPEVCLRAQGWEFVSERYLGWEGLLPNAEILPVKEIVCRQVHKTLPTGDKKEMEDVILPNGEKAYIWKVFYYTFVGHEKVLAGHYQRTIEDIKDRLFKGHDQRWAYATFSCYLTKKHAVQGLSNGTIMALDQAETEAHIRAFLKDLFPLVLSAPGEGFDESLESGKDLGS